MAISIERVMYMEQQKNQSPKKKKRKKKPEKVNWKEIMGINRDIYTRHNGAIRRK